MKFEIFLVVCIAAILVFGFWGVRENWRASDCWRLGHVLGIKTAYLDGHCMTLQDGKLVEVVPESVTVQGEVQP